MTFGWQRLIFVLKVFFLVFGALQATAQHQSGHLPPTTRVLWFNGMVDVPSEFRSSHRELMAKYIDEYKGGAQFEVTYRKGPQKGDLAAALNAGPFDILILDSTDRKKRMNGADEQALRQFYGSGRNQIMLDGTLYIRSIKHNRTTNFPGANGSSGGLLMNQLFALAERGGGILIGTDHTGWQVNANIALNALVPGAKFSGRTNPSTDGDFIGTTLIGSREIIKAKDILRHWESVPSQAETPVGEFTDFMGRPVVFYSLVETADKPGGGRKRPYISASFYPGDRRIPIDSAQEIFDNIPTHKSGG